jgi:wyosine [tRNA(Phe)-imidazoG37] synthetase (radical SAM superfamily)
VARRCFYDVENIFREISELLDKFREDIDYITLVPDGEPTLDACIGRIIEGVKREHSVKIAVLTNASLLSLSDVRVDLAEADYLSVKVDTVNEETWRKLNRPHSLLKLSEILEGIVEFSKSYKGLLTSETMLVHNVNTSLKHYEDVAKYLKKLSLHKTYISIPIRPPAEPYVKPPLEEEIIKAYNTFSKLLGFEKVELLNMPEPPPSGIYGDPITWLLNTTSVHPLRYDYAIRALEGLIRDPERVIEDLVEKRLIVKIQYRGEVFLLRNFKQNSN